MSIQFIIPGAVARAIDLGACARYRGAPETPPSDDYGLEGLHTGGNFIFLCSPVLVPYLVRDIEAAAATSDTSHFRTTCERAIAAMRDELARAENPTAFPARTVAPAFGRNSMNR
jgi:hypothetical protein